MYMYVVIIGSCGTPVTRDLLCVLLLCILHRKNKIRLTAWTDYTLRYCDAYVAYRIPSSPALHFTLLRSPTACALLCAVRCGAVLWAVLCLNERPLLFVRAAARGQA
jgi:hypothetical protein